MYIILLAWLSRQNIKKLTKITRIFKLKNKYLRYSIIFISLTIFVVIAEVSIGILYAYSVLTNKLAWLGVQFCVQLYMIFLCLVFSKFFRNFASIKGQRIGIPRIYVIAIKWYMLTGYKLRIRNVNNQRARMIRR